jgi:fructose-1,6-bisphosphatase II
VDPLDGTRLTAQGQQNAIAVIAVAERGTLFFPGAAFYMEKLAVGPEAADAIDLEAGVAENARRVAKAKRLPLSEISALVLDRPRNEPAIAELRALGVKVKLLLDGDVAPAIAAAAWNDAGVDLVVGIGGTPEGVISAAALKCAGGAIQGRLWPRDDEERSALRDAGLDPERILTTDDLVGGEDVFVAVTGVTTGALLRGVRSTPEGAVTDSLVMRSRSGTIRRIEARHAFEKLSRLSGDAYR